MIGSRITNGASTIVAGLCAVTCGVAVIVGIGGGIDRVGVMHSSIVQGKAMRPTRILAHASLAYNFRTWGQLKAMTDLAVVGVAGSQSMVSGPQQMPWTDTTVEVQQILLNRSGVAPAEVVVRQLGGMFHNVPVSSTDFPLLAPGTRYLFFLTRDVLDSSKYFTVGSFQGVFAISPDGQVNSLAKRGDGVGVVVDKGALPTIVQTLKDAPEEQPSP